MVRWGILGCGGIARRMARVLFGEADAQIVAVAARNRQRAAAFAQEFGVETAYGSYDELAEDRRVDAVYIATIHPTHAAAIELCLRAGKAVLCEKPMTMSSDEAGRLFTLAEKQGVPLVEAMWTRFLPAWQTARRLAGEGAIGEVRGMDADFSGWAAFDPSSRLFDPAQGGGTLWDVGIYCCHAALHVFGRDYRALHAVGGRAANGVDSHAILTVEYPQDRTAILTCAWDRCGAQAARIYGTQGWMELPHMFDASEVRLYVTGREPQVLSFPHEDGFVYEVREFHRLLFRGAAASEVMPPEDTVTALRMIETALSRFA